MRSLFFYKSSIFAKGEAGANANPDGSDSPLEMVGGDRPYHRKSTVLTARDTEM